MFRSRYVVPAAVAMAPRQQNQRRKWIHLFEDTHGVLFVLSMVEYDQVGELGGNASPRCARARACA